MAGGSVRACITRARTRHTYAGQRSHPPDAALDLSLHSTVAKPYRKSSAALQCALGLDGTVCHGWISFVALAAMHCSVAARIVTISLSSVLVAIVPWHHWGAATCHGGHRVAAGGVVA